MSAERRADNPAMETIDDGFDAQPLQPTEAELRLLRAQNTSLGRQLALRDHALDATPTFFVICEFAEPGWIIVYCNKVVAEQHGLRRQDLLGQPVSILTQWAGRNPKYASDVEAALRAGQNFRYEDEVTRPDGTTFWLGISVRPLFDDAGKLTHSVAVGADITSKREEMLKKQELQDKLVAEMKERERVVIELQLAQKLESVGRLAAGIAHEINTPIQYVGDSLFLLRSAYDEFNQLLDSVGNAIDILPDSDARSALQREMSELMKKHDVEYLRAEMPKAFERTFDGVDRVTNIVSAMKEFAHPDGDEQSAADLNHAIDNTLLVTSNEYKYLAKVRKDFAELPPVVCNIGELNQVFVNLIVNAAHAIQDAGKDVNTGEIRISTAIDGDAAVVRVGDNGCGVPAENLSKLYDPFFTTKEVGRGSGQGLAISHSIVVDKHSGDMSVSSTVGVGTEFAVRVPIAGRRRRSSP